MPLAPLRWARIFSFYSPCLFDADFGTAEKRCFYDINSRFLGLLLRDPTISIYEAILTYTGTYAEAEAGA